MSHGKIDYSDRRFSAANFLPNIGPTYFAVSFTASLRVG